MKNLLLLILIILAGYSYGQDRPIAVWELMEVHSDTIYTIAHPEHYAVNQSIDKLVKYYETYELECYNDSTEIAWMLTPLNDYTDIVTPIYGHLKKPTFEGFMEYLKKRK